MKRAKAVATATSHDKSPLTRLLERVEFQPENVVAAAAENSVLFLEAINYRLDCMRRRSAAKLYYERERARLDTSIRANARADGDRVTEKQIESTILLDVDLERANRSFQDAEEEDEYSKLIVEVFRMRRDCLRIVEGATRDEMSLQRAAEVGAEKMRETRQRLRERFPGEA